MVGPVTFAAVNDALEVSVHDAVTGQVGFQLSSHSATLTVTFEGTVNGNDWETLQVTKLDDGTTVTTAAADGIFRADAAGLLKVRARASTVTGGSVVVDALPQIG